MSLRRRSNLPLVALVLALLLPACTARSAGLLFSQKSEFNDLFVNERTDGVRELLFERNGALQSAVRPGKPLDLQLAYTRASMVALGAVPRPKKVLIIGLGGGAMPMFLRALDPKVQIDAVDIDPAVVQVARRWFGFREDERLKAHVADGRRFVETSKEAYDLVFLDAYGKSSAPLHLATAEFLAALKARLAPGGLAVGNVWSGDSNEHYAAMLRTWSSAFGGFCELAVPGSGNRIFLARAEPGPFDTEAIAAALSALERERRLPFELSDYAAAGCQSAPALEAVEVLRDPAP